MKKILLAVVLGLLSAAAQAQIWVSVPAAWVRMDGGAPAPSGSVTSIDCSGNAVVNCLGGPITTSGTFTLGLQTQSANLFFLGPASGVAAVPTFRAITPADIATGSNGECLSILSYAGGTFDWIACGGAGISDGDKGDITVSNSGATWDIDAGVIGSTELATAVKTFTLTLEPEIAQFSSTASSFATFTVANGTNFPVSALRYTDADATDDAAYWKFDAIGYASGNITARIYWYADSTTSGDVIWGCAIAAITPNTDTTDVETKSLATASTVTDSHLGTTAQRVHSADCAISNLDSVAADDVVWFKLYRDGDAAGDTLNGIVLNVLMVRLSYLRSF